MDCRLRSRCLLVELNTNVNKRGHAAHAILGDAMEVIYLTPCEVAQIINVEVQTVHRMIRDGRLPAANISSDAKPSYRISMESVNLLMAPRQR